MKEMPNSRNSSSSEDGEWDINWYPSPLKELTNFKNIGKIRKNCS